MLKSFTVALEDIVDLDNEEIMDRLKDYFEEKDLSARALPDSATKLERDQMELHKHFSSYVKGKKHQYKAKVLANLGAYRFFCKISEMNELPREERITIKQCAEDYCKEFGM